MLSGRTAAQEWPTNVRPLEQLAILAFWPISEKGEDCLCGTIPESRATFIETSESGGEDRWFAERGLFLGDRWLAIFGHKTKQS